MSLKIVTVTIDVLPAVVPLGAANIVGEDQLIGANEVSLEDYGRAWGVAFAMVLLHNLRRLYCVANYLYHSSIRHYGDLFADFAHVLTASRSPNTARIADFLTTVFQLLRYEMVQAYRGWSTCFVMKIAPRLNRLCARARNCREEPGPTISEVLAT